MLLSLTLKFFCPQSSGVKIYDHKTMETLVVEPKKSIYSNSFDSERKAIENIAVRFES